MSYTPPALTTPIVLSPSGYTPPALTVPVVLGVAAPAEPLRARHVAPSRMRFEPFCVRHAAPSRLRGVPSLARHVATSRMRFEPFFARHIVPSGSAVHLWARHEAPWSFTERPPLWARHVGVTGSAVVAVARHVATSRMRYPSFAARHVATSELLLTDPVFARHVAPSSLIDDRVQVYDGAVTLTHAGRELTLGVPLEISCDEGAPTWRASLTLEDGADYARVRTGDALTLTLYGTDYALFCDSKQYSRAGDAPDYRITALSPAALLDAPWALPITLGAPGTARAVVERLLGQTITWDLVDWTLPPLASEMEGTPLALARSIVGAVGGLLESFPDGALRARRADPVSIPEYASITPAAVLTDADLMGHSASIDTPEIANRFVISSGDTPVDQVQVEAEPDPDDRTHYTVRAYPVPWRPLELVHTGDAATQLGARVESYTEHAKLVEIQAGEGRLQYPAQTLISTRYQHTDLGAIRQPDPTTLATATAAYSQIQVSYRARCWVWRVSNVTRPETIQFLVTE